MRQSPGFGKASNFLGNAAIGRNEADLQHRSLRFGIHRRSAARSHAGWKTLPSRPRSPVSQIVHDRTPASWSSDPNSDPGCHVAEFATDNRGSELIAASTPQITHGSEHHLFFECVRRLAVVHKQRWASRWARRA